MPRLRFNVETAWLRQNRLDYHCRRTEKHENNSIPGF